MMYNNFNNYNPYMRSDQRPGIQWVQGLAGAKSFLVGAGESQLLMDSEANVFYIKSTDASGMPLPLRIFDYKERVETPQTGEYVTREEFLKAIEELKGVKNESSV